MGYTGNNHHARKEEMIHDRELIYDAKKQLHRADQSYKDSPSKMYGDPAAKNITKVLSEGAKHNAAPKMYDDAAPKFNAGLRQASADNKLSGKFKQAVDAAPKMSADLSDDPLQKDMLSNQMGGYAGDASGAQYNAAAPMMEALVKPALMMKKGIASMCGMKK